MFNSYPDFGRQDRGMLHFVMLSKVKHLISSKNEALSV
ncbi:hypothetical protein A33Q_3477 [Indibacter alkaliphilus LW1]|uniref:Uncharacterized protein n=1 Tax=Indibacter alkaliphilus (strain CCUG 57479 / KCTC 22604 / LW1) TaxID=1189612 RepID=S2D3H8_INDAL|nr:hypothetical protein A33Q_3477 [Indibacter alkaliphilus LW1]